MTMHFTIPTNGDYDQTMLEGRLAFLFKTSGRLIAIKAWTAHIHQSGNILASVIAMLNFSQEAYISC